MFTASSSLDMNQEHDANNGEWGCDDNVFPDSNFIQQSINQHRKPFQIIVLLFMAN